jgi:hypothetical protein
VDERNLALPTNDSHLWLPIIHPTIDFSHRRIWNKEQSLDLRRRQWKKRIEPGP